MAFDYATISDLRTAEVVHAEYMRLLADRNSLPNHPVFAVGYKDATGLNSTTVKVGFVGLDGYDSMTAPGDGSAVGATDLTDASGTVTIAGQRFRRDPTDLARMTDPGGNFSPARFARDMVGAANARLVDLVAALASGFSTVVGTSGSDATLQNLLDCKRALNVANADGPLLGVFHPTQWADIMDDLTLNSGGAVQWEPAAPALRAVLGNGYQGRLAGIDVYTTTRVGTANGSADRAGMVVAPGAILWADAAPIVDDPSRQQVFGRVLFEMDRQAASAITSFVGHYTVGVAEGLDAAGVALITDA